MGNTELDCVENSNAILSRFALILVLCLARDVYWCVEQPVSSVLKKTPYFAFLMGLQKTFPRRVGTSEP